MKTWRFMVGIIVSGILGLQLVSCSGTEPHQTPSSVASESHSYRPPIRATGTLHVVVTRATSSPYRLVDMNDRGDVLYLASKRGERIREYVHEYKGTLVERREARDWNNYNLCPDGQLFRDLRDPLPELAPSIEFPFGADLEGLKLFSDRSVLAIRSKHDPKFGKDLYVLDRDTQSETPLKVVSNPGAMISTALTNAAPRPATSMGGGQPSAGGSNGTGVGSVQFYSRSKEIYASASPMTLLEKGDTDSIWIREHHGNSKSGSDKLIRIDGTSPTEVPLAARYSSVFRVCNTGNSVAATFGTVGGEQPIRSHVLDGKKWKELPIPAGFEFSFVQKILFDGSIVGFVTTADGKSIRQVLWKGDSVAILNDLPGWPKGGIFTIIMIATRGGGLYVRNVLNSESSAGDYYLLSISTGQ